MGVKIFVTLESPDPKTSARQSRMISILVQFNVPHVLVDLSAKDRDRKDQKEFMKAKAKKRPGQDAALPPQIFNSGRYCGDYEDFRIAYEGDTMDTFLGVKIRRPEDNVIDTTFLEEEGEAGHDIYNIQLDNKEIKNIIQPDINIPVELEEENQEEMCEEIKLEIIEQPVEAVVTEEPIQPTTTVRDTPELFEDATTELDSAIINGQLVESEPVINIPDEIEEENAAESVEETYTRNRDELKAVIITVEPYLQNIKVLDKPKIKVGKTEPVINIPDEIVEENEIENVTDIFTQKSEEQQKVRETKEPIFHIITVIYPPNVHEHREPEPLNMKPRNKPEPETKPKVGKISQSVHMMLAYQSMYN